MSPLGDVAVEREVALGVDELAADATELWREGIPVGGKLRLLPSSGILDEPLVLPLAACSKARRASATLDISTGGGTGFSISIGWMRLCRTVATEDAPEDRGVGSLDSTDDGVEVDLRAVRVRGVFSGIRLG